MEEKRRGRPPKNIIDLPPIDDNYDEDSDMKQHDEITELKAKIAELEAGAKIVAVPAKEAKKVEFVTISIDLGDTASHISVNGHEYHHGNAYLVPKEMVPDLNYMMHATKAHDENYKFGINRNASAPRRLN